MFHDGNSVFGEYIVAEVNRLDSTSRRHRRSSRVVWQSSVSIRGSWALLPLRRGTAYFVTNEFSISVCDSTATALNPFVTTLADGFVVTFAVIYDGHLRRSSTTRTACLVT